MSTNSLVDHPPNSRMLIKNFFSAGDRMSFGSELRVRRKDKRFTQEGLAKAANSVCTGAFISDLERDYYIGKKGRPTRPDIDIVDALAAVLDWPLSEARLAAGYAPPESSAPYELSIHDILPSGYDELPPERQAKFREQLRLIGRVLMESEQ